jgi:spore maturation protein CgeB
VNVLLESNLRALAARHPILADALASAEPLTSPLEPSRCGLPTLVADGVLLHNRHDPRNEADTWGAAQCERLAEAGAATAVVLGFGLGYHLEALAARFAGRIVVVEPDRRLLRTTLAARDLQRLLARVEIIDTPLRAELIDGFGDAVVLAHAPSVLREGTALRLAGEQIGGRIALRGLSLHVLLVSPVSGGSYPITHHCARALTALGHRVSVLDLAPFAGAAQAIGGFSPRREASRRLQESFTNFLGLGVLEAVAATEPDLVLALAQAPLNAPILAELGRRGVLRAFWFVEDHRLLPYWRDVAGEYDYFFAIQQGAVLAEMARICRGRVAYLPCAADPEVHRPLSLSTAEQREFGAPVGFMGAGYRNRRIAFRPLLDLGLKIWGSDWEGAGQVEAALQRGGARIATEDAVRIFNATAVNLNLHSSTWVDGVDPRGDFVNPRTFELAACGAFQLVDRRALLPPLLEPEVEVATFTEAGELRERVRHYLDRPAERARLAAAGRARVLAEHTYRHRMQALLETVSARDHERLRARPRVETVAQAARAAGDTPLGALLRQLQPTVPFTLDGVVGGLEGRTGDLSEAEAILLFLHQFDELYVREARA